jgi:hypothetical protein
VINVLLLGIIFKNCYYSSIQYTKISMRTYICPRCVIKACVTNEVTHLIRTIDWLQNKATLLIKRNVNL